MRIVDLETKSMNAPRPATTSRRLESRIEELTSQLNQSTKDSSRIHRTADKALAEAERQRAKLEEEVTAYETKIVGMRKKMDEMVRNPSLYHSQTCTLTFFTANIREQPDSRQAPR